jgi:hypothetical protein
MRLSKATLPDPPPTVMKVAVEWPQPEASIAVAAPGLADARSPSSVNVSIESQLKAGDRATVVKSRISGPKHPPEWLGQYVGKTGVVLWTTINGAVLRLNGTATWFAWDELEVSD